MNKKFLHLKDMAWRYAGTLRPHARQESARAMVVAFLAVQLGGVMIDAMAAGVTSGGGDSFKDEFYAARAERANMWIYIGLACAVAVMVMDICGTLGDVREAKRFATAIVKRRMKDSHVDISKLNTGTFLQIADLILANMTMEERDAILKVELDLQNKIRQNAISAMYYQKTYKQCNNANLREFCGANSAISDTVDVVIDRNPELSNLIMDIVNGKTLCNSDLFVQPQKCK
ncbi:MAG: hypothetical protein J6T57_02070 [Alphaproteobacteria bacterium]|nr:hypothetical protein [Alphaproteobacteria bacterium]